MRRWRSWAGAVVVALGAACGGNGSENEPSTATSPEPSEPAAVEQYAAVVSERSPELQEVIAAAAVCLDGYQYPCEAGEAIAEYRVSLQASLLAGDLRSGDEPPAEIEELLERTMAAAEAAQLHAEAFDDGSCGPQPGVEAKPAESCADTAQFALLANNELKAAMLAWDQYR